MTVDETITVDEAIKDIELLIEYPKTPLGLHTLKSLNLGKEALKFKQAWLNGHYFPWDYLLPGETKEADNG